MRILPKYLAWEFSKLFLLFLVLFTFLYLFIDFTQVVDNFMEANVPKGHMLAYLYYEIPFIIPQMAPVAALLAVIVLIGVMRKNNEIMAVTGCGVSLYELARPLVLLSLFISALVFFFAEMVVPQACLKKNEIWRHWIKGGGRTASHIRNHIWYKGDHSIYWIGQFDTKRQMIKDLSLFVFDERFHIKKRIEARRAMWTGTHWRLGQGVIQEPGAEGGYLLTRFDELDVTLSERPERLARPVRKPEEMGYWQLKRYAKEIEDAGYDSTHYLVELNIRLSFPLINLVLVVIGIPLAAGIKKGGIPQAVTAGVGMCLIFLIVFGISRSFGLSGLLPPVISAWLANGIFFLLGIYLMIRTNAARA